MNDTFIRLTQIFINKTKFVFKRIIENEIQVSILITIVLILGSFAIGFENNKVIPINSDITARYALEPNNPLKIFSNWDGPDYLKIS